jgi:hypothetical protein
VQQTNKCWTGGDVYADRSVGNGRSLEEGGRFYDPRRLVAVLYVEKRILGRLTGLHGRR